MANNIQTTEPFSDDQLGRKVIAEHFKNILLNTNLNVFSLVAPWGCGKTYFIQNLIRAMEENSVNILYNAWESDFYDSPLIPLLVELLNKIENSYDKTELEEDIKSVKEVVKNICSKTSFQAGLNFGIANCSVNFDPSKKIIESEYIELKNLINEFRSRLKVIPERLNKKIVIFIDELDRCNPMYTIKTLEVIKHFFGIPNIVFVLAVDKSQIENSVRTIFGVNQGTENGYLRKFIDVEFELPKYSSKEFITVHLLRLIDKIEKFKQGGRYYNYRRQKDSPTEAIWLVDFIFFVTNMFGFSLRDLEKFFIRFDLLLDTLAEKDVLLIEPLIILNVLAMRNMKDFDDYINSNSEADPQVKEIDKLVLPLWKGFLFNKYKTTVNQANAQSAVRYDTIESNARGIYDFLYNSISRNIDEQEKYLQDYPLKIKFIHNFNTIN